LKFFAVAAAAAFGGGFVASVSKDKWPLETNLPPYDAHQIFTITRVARTLGDIGVGRKKEAEGN
jgi:hypothetical protein